MQNKSDFLPPPFGRHWNAAPHCSWKNVAFCRALRAPESLVEQFLYQRKAAGWKSTSQADSGAAAPD